MSNWIKKADEYNSGRIFALMEDLNTVAESLRQMGLIELADKADAICQELDTLGGQQ